MLQITYDIFFVVFVVGAYMNLPCSQCASIPSRFAYTDDSQVPEISDTKLKLLEESRTADTMPLDFYKQLDNVTDVSEFIEKFVDKESLDPKWGLQANYRRDIERASVLTPTPASCIPEKTVVELTPFEPSTDPSIIYYPKCTRIKLCSGCCNSPLMSCQPTATELLNFQVLKLQHGKLLGKEIVVKEQHTKCKCDCRIKEKDCNAYQIYHPELCSCACTNNDARSKCSTKDHKIWDEHSCRCVCRDSLTCTTGTIFNENLCQCVEPSNSSDGASTSTSAGFFSPPSPTPLDRKRFILPAIPVETDDASVYTTV